MLNKELNRLLLNRRDEILKELDAIDTILNSKDSTSFYEDVFKYIYINENKVKNKFMHKNNCEVDSKFNFNTKCDLNSNIKFYGGGNAIPIEAKDKDTTWKNYLIEVIDKIGGKAKTSEIAYAIIFSNKDLSFIKARQTAADILPELVEEGKLDVEKGDSRKEGNLYKLIAKNNKIKNSRTDKPTLEI